MSYQTSSKRSPPFWLLIGARKLCFSGTNHKPERRRPFGTGLVRHCPQGLLSPFFTFLRSIYFSARLDFSSSPLSAPGSPRMRESWCERNQRKTIVNSWVRCLENNQLVITSAFPTVNFRKG